MTKGTTANKGKVLERIRELEAKKGNFVIMPDQESAHTSGLGIEDRLIDSLDRGIKVESLALTQLEITRIVDWAWDKKDGLKTLRLKSAPLVADRDIPKVQNAKGKLETAKVPSPTYIDGLIRPMINTETQGRTTSNCMGFFQPDRFEDSVNNERLGLINYSPEFFNAKRLKYEDNNELQLIETIVHESVHMINSANGFKDCSKQRHNLKFKETAEAVGLECLGDGKDKKIGWGHTKLSDKLKGEAMALQINPDALKYFANELAKPKSGNRAKAVRWECPEACGEDGNNVGFRTTSSQDFNIACMNCSDIDNSKGKGTIDQLVMYVRKEEGEQE